LPAQPQILSAQIGTRSVLSASGSWTARYARELDEMLDKLPLAPIAGQQIELNLEKVEALDTYGAWLLEKLRRHTASAEAEGQLVKVDERYRGLMGEIREVNRRPALSRPIENPFGAWIELLGRVADEIGRDFLSLLEMLGAILQALIRIILHPRRLRFTSMVHHIDRVGLQALPIVLMITFLIGAIIFQQGTFYFRKFGAGEYAVNLVGVLVLREIGVLLVAIMVAGRSGSSYTAELGAMKMREEIDALNTMGLDPIEVLILPRILALIIALPLLTLLGSLAALYGGEIVAQFYAGMAPQIYLARLNDAISVTQVKVGMFKAPFMALVIGAVAASEGMKVKGSAESLGLRTTASVVKSIFLVIVIDGLFAIFYTSIGW
jgi:phospholipid/cholesterol/gamma-HCH transport system permease protein